MIPPSSLRANPNNGVLHAGHHNGVVTMWSPAMGSPLVRMLAHPAPITSLAVDRSGHYMVTAAMDKQVRRAWALTYLVRSVVFWTAISFFSSRSLAPTTM